MAAFGGRGGGLEAKPPRGWGVERGPPLFTVGKILNFVSKRPPNQPVFHPSDKCPMTFPQHCMYHRWSISEVWNVPSFWLVGKIAYLTWTLVNTNKNECHPCEHKISLCAPCITEVSHFFTWFPTETRSHCWSHREIMTWTANQNCSQQQMKRLSGMSTLCLLLSVSSAPQVWF